MTLIVFDDPISAKRHGAPVFADGHTQTVVQPAPVITETVSVVSERRDFLLTESAQWTWSQLRDFVIAEIESRFGAQPRDQKKEAAIFKRFLSAWGEQAGAIAQYAFTQDNGSGWWKGAKISVNRFCKGSDEFFAAVIVQQLAERS
jgi:hypothetical protein